MQLPNQIKEEKTGVYAKFKAIGDDPEEKLIAATSTTTAEHSASSAETVKKKEEEKPAEKVVTLKSSSFKPVAFKKRKTDNQSIKQRSDE